MNFLTAIKTCFQKYADFSGRASRPEFWWFYLFFYLIYFVCILLAFMVSDVFFIVFFGFVFVIFLPWLAAGARRMHDVNKSAWWVLLTFVPFASLALMYFQVQPGDVGDNQFGSPPSK
ncbi:MAG TPA: DUF805 domain-containing protein [Methylotenera sp.]|nr:DUF805 domain-containing protein [Methylotenera sp.]HPH05505.1 DUF805 domain-containing protein [Methylotenera sp.]HPN00081.1 DUF805 domain-containing protein [Methylotenera sp.]